MQKVDATVGAFQEVPLAIDAGTQISAVADAADAVHLLLVENAAFPDGECHVRHVKLGCGPS